MIQKFFSTKYLSTVLDDEYDEADLYFDVFILWFIFLGSVIYVLQTLDISEKTLNILNKIDFLLNILFTFEFFMRIFYSKNLAKHFRSIYTWIDFIAIFPFWIGFGSYSFFRIFRFFRFFRFSRLFDYSEKLRQVKNNRLENIFVSKILFSLVLFLYVSSGLIYEIEGDINPAINSFPDAVYFMLISITTVGYGDIYPISNAGRLVIMGTVLLSLTIIPYHIGNLMKQINSANKNYQVCKKCKFSGHDKNAHYCKICGTSLKTNTTPN